MAEFNQFGSTRPSQTADTKQCTQFEAMLADAVDGSLTAKEMAAFELHLLGCARCTETLVDAKRGAAWMGMLREHAPEPPAAMLERIFHQTSGAQTGGAQTIGTRAGGAQPNGAQASGVLTIGVAGATGGLTQARVESSTGSAVGLGLVTGPDGLTEAGLRSGAVMNVLPFRRRVAGRLDVRGAAMTLLQPRLAMTAAMAFFSIALTLNLMGVRLSGVRVNDLRPSNLRRSVYQANAHVVRYVTNLREVYELESRVHDLQRSSDSGGSAMSGSEPTTKGGGSGADSGAKKDGQPESQPKRKPSPGTSRREPLHDELRVLAGLAHEPEYRVVLDGMSARCESAPPQKSICMPRKGERYD